MKNSSSYRLQKFFKKADRLRDFFSARFDYSSPKTASPFVWDYWHIPNRYTLLRTPAYLFFPKKIYNEFHNQLVWWGRRNLGCHDVSPTWLSCYIEGCEQRTHVDLPHGPWAFVFSLTPWQTRQFLGGETFLKTNLFERKRGVQKIPAKFNQLLVFDPSVPHGVEKVSGVRDVKQGRLVINGWFVNPRPFIEGPISTTELAQQIYKVDEFIYANTELFRNLAGALCFQIQVSPSGKILNVIPLATTLKGPRQRSQDLRPLITLIKGYIFKTFTFTKQKTSSLITLPLIFE